ncbi:unnamed protein product, partial [Vitis vinifera]
MISFPVHVNQDHICFCSTTILESCLSVFIIIMRLVRVFFTLDRRVARVVTIMWWLLSLRWLANWGWWLVFRKWFLSLGRFTNWGWWLVLRWWLLDWRGLGVISKRWDGENHHSKEQH